MKQLIPALIAALALPIAAFAQGPLTPPGAPAPLFKTLTQVEPRTPVQTLAGDGTAVFVINQPGSYYLTGNVTSVVSKAAIAIDSDNVSLDLAGFALVGVAGATTGVEIRNTHTAIAVRNGIIRGFDTTGVGAAGIQRDVVVEHMTISGISAGYGINFANGGSSTNLVVRHCTVSGASLGGIQLSTARGTVEHCTVAACASASGATGILANQVSDCEVSTISSSASGVATGISGQNVVNCVVNSVVSTNSVNNALGITATTVTGCQVGTVTSSSALAVGISAVVVEGCQVSGVNATAGGVALGISGSAASIANCRITSIGTATPNVGNAFGISATTAAIQNCVVSGVGGSGSVGVATGIAGSSVANSAVSSVGVTNSAGGAVGISATTITGCTVSSVSGGSTGSTTGIGGMEVAHSTVSFVKQFGGVGTSTGISAPVVSDCRVDNVSAGATGTVTGMSGVRMAHKCQVTTVSSSGGGQAIGCQSGGSGRIEAVTVNAATDVGISVNTGVTVVGCTTDFSTTGILATGTKNVIDGNNITGTGTTGISCVSGANTANALVIRNQVRSCTVKFQLDAPCQSGPIVSATGAIASTSPWANFTD